MGFLLSHWHCILPLGIFLVIYLFSGKIGKTKSTEMASDIGEINSSKSIETLNKKLAIGEITQTEYQRKKELLDHS